MAGSQGRLNVNIHLSFADHRTKESVAVPHQISHQVRDELKHFLLAELLKCAFCILVPVQVVKSSGKGGGYESLKAPGGARPELGEILRYEHIEIRLFSLRYKRKVI